MQKVSPIKENPELKQFVDEVNEDIGMLNELIADYNQTTTNEARIAKLKDILHFKQDIENKYGDRLVSKCPDFSKNIQHQLFSEIQKEFKECGVPSLYGIDSSNVPPRRNTFSEILTDMEPDKVNRLIQILSEGAQFDKGQLAQLYSPEGNDKFNEFLKSNEISFLGGGNSKNFKITPNDGNPPYVLKIENRMGMPKAPVVHLRNNSLKDTLTPVMAERQSTVETTRTIYRLGDDGEDVAIIRPGPSITRTILTTEFCTGGNLVEHSKKHGEDEIGLQKRTSAALNIYGKMLSTLIGISNDGCAFPDMKNTNWLVGVNGEPEIADTKSFVFCNEQGELDLSQIESKKTGGTVLSSDHVNPREIGHTLFQYEPISADKMHAYMFGKNLYQYVTGCSDSALFLVSASTNKNPLFSSRDYFDLPIFKTKEGIELKGLITALISLDPSKRISLVEAQEQLNRILEGKKQPAFDILTAIEKQDDIKMRGFIQEKRDLIARTNDLGELEDITRGLNEILQRRNTVYQRLNEIQEHTIGNNDVEMNKFIQEKRDLIAGVNDPGELENIARDLEGILQQQKKAVPVRDQVQTLRNEAGTSSMVLDQVANIEQQMSAISIEDRGTKLGESTSEERQQITTEIRRVRGQLCDDRRQSACAILDEIQKHAIGDNDIKMLKFITEKQELIARTDDPKALEKITSGLDKILKQQYIADEVQKIIQGFIDKDGLFSIGMKAKAEKIQWAIYDVPIEERGRIMDGTYELGRQVQTAIASHRHFAFARSTKWVDNELDSKTAAKSFLSFKERLNEMRANDPSKANTNTNPEENENASTPGLGRK